MGTITRTWSDNAGNSGNQIITVTDTGVAPTFTNANAAVLDVTVACNACIDADSCVTGLQATDDCSAVVVTFSDSTPTTSCDVASCTQSVSIVRTWNAVDDCGEDVFVCPTATPVPTVEEDCRFICDDDDSAASSLIASVFVILAALAVALF